MAYYFSLRIETNILNKENLENIIGLKANTEYFTWEYELMENKNINFIKYFMDIIEEKLPILDSFGVERSEITIWMLYGYEFQCNMEFEAEDLLRLGKNGIDLCISCWDEGVPPIIEE